MRFLLSLTLSLVASAAGTYLLRQLLSAQSAGVPGQAGSSGTVVVVVPIFTGNSNNHIFHLEKRRGLFGL